MLTEAISDAGTGGEAQRPAIDYQAGRDRQATGRRLAILTLTALGVVYGDIGTSPLYTMREAFSPSHGLRPDVASVYGILSLLFWTIVLVAAVKYLAFILKADNNGEGGVLAMLALLLQRQHRGDQRGTRTLLIVLGVFGTALLYGDGIITPAISVLGAIEGLGVVAPSLSSYVVGITIAILLALFFFQQFGTARVGKAFGPITLLWFVVIGVLGLMEIAHSPRILLAASPVYAVRFFVDHGYVAFAALGAVFLCVTGAEALFADLGHFGKRPIRLAFFGLAMPALLLNYFGQGALLLRMPEAIENPFYLLAPRWFLYPLLVLATLAAIVASQALISGAFSLARQAVQLGYTPRLTVVHTSQHEFGQIYVPQVNWALMIGTLCIVVAFGSSSALGSAYGIAVTGTMVITTILYAVITRTRWKWPLWQVYGLAGCFLVFDLGFLGANALKIKDGGWVPLALALVLFVIMMTWKRGRELLTALMQQASLPLELFLEDLGKGKVPRVRGTAVFLTSNTQGAPVVLLHHLKHNKSLHEQVILLSVKAAEVPEVDDAHRVSIDHLGQGVVRVVAIFGFMESPDVPRVMTMCEARGIHTVRSETTYYLGHERLIPANKVKLAMWRKRIFAIMSRNARPATEFFGLPPNRVVELGAQIEF